MEERRWSDARLAAFVQRYTDAGLTDMVRCRHLLSRPRPLRRLPHPADYRAAADQAGVASGAGDEENEESPAALSYEERRAMLHAIDAKPQWAHEELQS
jgi:hypothetical protein